MPAAKAKGSQGATPPAGAEAEQGHDVVPRAARPALHEDDLGAATAGALGDAEVVALLRSHRGTSREAEALRRVLTYADGLGPAGRLAAADLLAARGERDKALSLLAPATTAEALLLAADLFAARGEVARAIGTVERVLARDLNLPGARERHTRWRAELGLTAKRPGAAAPTAIAPDVGRTPYRVLREVARGGAGAVYEAEEPDLGRRVAFKVYHRRGADRRSVEREARVTAALAGPGVLRIWDVGPEDGWIAFEWLPRGAIRDLLRTGAAASLWPLSAWIRPLLQTLARLHEGGWVHGDVKPANVLLRDGGSPLLADFGIAHRVGEPAEPGSAGYVAPARLAGRAADPRDDVYGLGRIVEDVLLAAGELGAKEQGWSAFYRLCLEEGPSQPADGRALLAHLQSDERLW